MRRIIISWLALYIYHPSLLGCFPLLDFKCLGHSCWKYLAYFIGAPDPCHSSIPMPRVVFLEVTGFIFVSLPDKTVWKLGAVSRVSWCSVAMSPKLV